MTSRLLPPLALPLLVFLTACAPPKQSIDAGNPADGHAAPASGDVAAAHDEPLTTRAASLPPRTEKSRGEEGTIKADAHVAQATPNEARRRVAVAAVAEVSASVRELEPPLPLAVVAAAYPQAFTPEQVRVLVQLGESFLAETTPTAPSAVTAVAGVGGDSELTPAERWVIRAEASDERFKAMFGYQAFNSMQLQRARTAYTEANK